MWLTVWCYWDGKMAPECSANGSVMDESLLFLNYHIQLGATRPFICSCSLLLAPCTAHVKRGENKIESVVCSTGTQRPGLYYILWDGDQQMLGLGYQSILGSTETFLESHFYKTRASKNKVNVNTFITVGSCWNFLFEENYKEMLKWTWTKCWRSVAHC